MPWAIDATDMQLIGKLNSTDYTACKLIKAIKILLSQNKMLALQRKKYLETSVFEKQI